MKAAQRVLLQAADGEVQPVTGKKRRGADLTGEQMGPSKVSQHRRRFGSQTPLTRDTHRPRSHASEGTDAAQPELPDGEDQPVEWNGSGGGRALEQARLLAEEEGLTLVMSRSCATGFKGVYKHCNRFEVRTRQAGKTIHLGHFASPPDAALAYARHLRTGACAHSQTHNLGALNVGHRARSPSRARRATR